MEKPFSRLFLYAAKRWWDCFLFFFCSNPPPSQSLEWRHETWAKQEKRQQSSAPHKGASWFSLFVCLCFFFFLGNIFPKLGFSGSRRRLSHGYARRLIYFTGLFHTGGPVNKRAQRSSVAAADSYRSACKFNIYASALWNLTRGTAVTAQRGKKIKTIAF